LILLHKPFDIAGQKIKPGERKQVRLKVSESFVSANTYIPLTVLRGKSSGPRVLITAAIHGDELNGIEIVRRLIYELNYERLKGILVCVPVVNIFGFQNATRYLTDGKDLNRCFPGDPSRWSQGRYASIVYNELVKKCDFVIDLHTAAAGRVNMPHIRGDMSNPEVERLARAFGTTVIMNNKGQNGSLRRAATDDGIPTIVFEAGETRKFEKRISENGLAGVINVLRELGMLEGERIVIPYQVVINSSTWIRAGRGGILSINVKPGRIVRKGKEIATNTNPFGKEVESIKTPFNGIVIGIATAPTVTPGQGVCHLFKIEEPAKAIRERLYHYYGKKYIVF